jgi:tetratricopeptide (TPR) repeat protein
MPQGKKKKKPAAKKEASPKKTAPAGKGDKTAAKKSSGEITPLQARGLIESEMAKVSRLLEGKNFESIEEAQAFLDGIIGGGGTIPELKPETPLDKAQELVYDAWQASGRERVKLAKKALEIYPDCADAYVILAEESGGNLLEVLEFFRSGVEAGERALGPDYFEEDVGHFWGIVETRPYMRARLGLAMVLWEVGKQAEAVKHLQDMLRLNPGDNQGMRYILASRLLMMDRDEELMELLDSYEDEPTACWSYTRALLSYRREGATGRSLKILKEALRRNPHVPAYLLRKRKLPDEPPHHIGFGDETEAIEYAFDFLLPWSLTPGALDWLGDAAG